MRCPECSRQTTSVRRVPSGIQAAACPATWILIGINAVAFFVELAAGGAGGLSFSGGKIIREGGLYGPDVANGDWWRIVTSAFLHAGFGHVALNMIGLYFLGRLLEPAIGTARFVALYFVSLLAGSAGVILVSPHTISVGASGAIFGLLAAAFVVARHRGLEQIAQQVAFFVVLNLAFTFGFPGISIGAHIGGLIGGAIAALIITYGQRRFPSLAMQLGAMAVLGAIFVAIALGAAPSV
jgi:membrane associated rhomboid family serine protease